MSKTPKYIDAFQKLTRRDATIDDLSRMELEFYGESPRSVILLSAMLTELGLEVALRKTLREGKETDALFAIDRGPIGTFAAKAKLAFALGLFEAITHHDLKLIRTLRNGFAHSSIPITFDAPEVAAVCQQLKLPDLPLSKVPEAYVRRSSKGEANDISHPKTRYVTSCNVIAVELFTFGRPREGMRALTPPLLP